MGSSQSVPEGSVTFSLLELGRLEEQRVREERDEAARRLRADNEARVAAERRAEEERAVQERQQSDALRAEERLAREEAARVDAMKLAILEKARKEAEDRARADDRDRQHRRDVELSAIARRGVETRLRRIAVAEGIALVAVLVVASVGYGAGIAPRTERRVAAAGAEVAQRDQTIAGLRAQIAAQEQALGAARTDLEAGATRAAALSADLEQGHRDLDKARKGCFVPLPVVAPVIHHGPETGFSTRCDPGSRDPLCASLGH